ncbi:MAG: thiamine phosphate synthase [Muribaculaceae bacterium]|nr:thiamine phosphate synthase [Muribaculaceae bacterium]
MKLIAITTPHFWPGEALAIRRLLDCGWSRVHIRKPEASPDELRGLIEAIPPQYYPRLSLHDRFDLALAYGLGGVHLNMRNPLPPHGWKGLVSRSCHSLEELAQFAALDYLTLSPVFDSISKPGYKSAFGSAALSSTSLKNVYALGGVSFSRLRELELLGFEGAAMLSEAWQTSMTSLQYITHTDEDLEAILCGGCRWVQLRMKDASDDDFSRMARRMILLCRKFNASFILDDRVHLVESLGADGVHLGKKDMPLAEARSILGPTRIIGATANTESDIIEAWNAGADYIGLGPFRFTTTKKGLSPILGLEGYLRIMSRCRSLGVRLPVVAIGGIRPDDLPAIARTGVNGIAVSGIVLNALDKMSITKEILRIWKNSQSEAGNSPAASL